MPDSTFVTAITTFSTKTITMKTTVQQTPPFFSRAEDRVSPLPLTTVRNPKSTNRAQQKNQTVPLAFCFCGGNLNSNWGITILFVKKWTLVPQFELVNTSSRITNHVFHPKTTNSVLLGSYICKKKKTDSLSILYLLFCSCRQHNAISSDETATSESSRSNPSSDSGIVIN
jgi:hypothetical protein